MERNVSTAGGDDSNFEDIMHEDGFIDELTSSSLDIPGRCAICPILGLETRGWKGVVDGVKKTREVIQAEGGVFSDIARQSPSGKMDDLALDGIARKIQARINRMTEGCLGSILLSGESDRTGRTVWGAVCDSPTRDSKSGVTTSDEIVAVTREKTEEYGESDNPSGEQDS